MAKMTLRQARERMERKTGKGATQIALEIGIARSTLYRMESGQHQPNEELARKVHAYYKAQGIRLAELAVLAPAWHGELVGVAA